MSKRALEGAKTIINVGISVNINIAMHIPMYNFLYFSTKDFFVNDLVKSSSQNKDINHILNKLKGQVLVMNGICASSSMLS